MTTPYDVVTAILEKVKKFEDFNNTVYEGEFGDGVETGVQSCGREMREMLETLIGTESVKRKR